MRGWLTCITYNTSGNQWNIICAQITKGISANQYKHSHLKYFMHVQLSRNTPYTNPLLNCSLLTLLKHKNITQYFSSNLKWAILKQVTIFTITRVTFINRLTTFEGSVFKLYMPFAPKCTPKSKKKQFNQIIQQISSYAIYAQEGQLNNILNWGNPPNKLKHAEIYRTLWSLFSLAEIKGPRPVSWDICLA